MLTIFARLAVEMRFTKLGVLMRLARLAVEMRFTKLAVLTTDPHCIVERYPIVPRPITVDVS